MVRDWCLPSDNLRLSDHLRHAAEAIVRQADRLVEEMDIGPLSDEGGPEALRLLAGVVRASGEPMPEVAGHA
jgi:hypothetical protein